MKRRDHTAKSKDEAVTFKGSHQQWAEGRPPPPSKEENSKKLSKLTNLETPKPCTIKSAWVKEMVQEVKNLPPNHKDLH